MYSNPQTRCEITYIVTIWAYGELPQWCQLTFKGPGFLSLHVRYIYIYIIYPLDLDQIYHDFPVDVCTYPLFWPWFYIHRLVFFGRNLYYPGLYKCFCLKRKYILPKKRQVFKKAKWWWTSGFRDILVYAKPKLHQ